MGILAIAKLAFAKLADAKLAFAKLGFAKLARAKLGRAKLAFAKLTPVPPGTGYTCNGCRPGRILRQLTGCNSDTRKPTL